MIAGRDAALDVAEEDTTLNERDLVTLVGWLTGLALMAWRSPDGARFPWSTALVGAAVWCALPLWEPSLRTAWHVGLTAAFLAGGLARWPGPPVEAGDRAANRESRGGEDHDPADSSVPAA